jgi:hypothetical protein
MYDMFRPVMAMLVPAGFCRIDVAEWPDGSNRSKDIDSLIYDKVRCNHSELEVKLLRPVQGDLERARIANTYYTLQVS